MFHIIYIVAQVVRSIIDRETIMTILRYLKMFELIYIYIYI